MLGEFLAFSTFKRDGIELPASFTATVNGEMKVGGVEETLTVTGEAPQVDVQTTSQQVQLGRTFLEATPTARVIQSMEVYVPGVQQPAGFASGLQNTTAQRALSIHGGRGTEHNAAVDGFPIRNMGGPGGTSDYYNTNDGTVAELVVSTASGGAEYQMGALVVNIIPKEGGNVVTGQVYFHYADQNMQANNISAALAQTIVVGGTGGAGAIRKSIDFNPGLGGPIVKDKLWFFGSFRTTDSNVDAGIAYNATPTAWIYTPDTSRPKANQILRDQSYSLRLTYQASLRNKFSVLVEDQPKFWYKSSAEIAFRLGDAGQSHVASSYLGTTGASARPRRRKRVPGAPITRSI